ncbi:hypothetical protein WANA31_0376 [Wolbachia endosymbiont of Drosophila ananassae]|nr:hypothetical protein WANA31_0376 [Wolbachia endosymbiont of Drosophila ananassae]RLT61199.1 hypothetical protein WANA34_0157 [Wolbachia endosymbiont of Drosophila ananassae]
MVTTFSMRLYGKLDPSVKHWDDKKRSTGMAPFVMFNKVRT